MVSFVRALLIIFSHLFHLLLVFFLIGISSVALIGGTHTLKLGVVPWEGERLTYWLFSLGLFGLISLGLAVTGKVRILFFLWTLAVLVILIRGFFFSPYAFTGPAEFKNAVYISLAASLAVLGAWLQLIRRPRRRR